MLVKYTVGSDDTIHVKEVEKTNIIKYEQLIEYLYFVENEQGEINILSLGGKMLNE